MSDQPKVTMEQVVEALQRANGVTTTQGERLNALEEQRNALAEALQRANTALNDAQQNAQEANQCTREIMGLIGQQWATLVPSHLESGRGSSAKIEIFSDPGPYDGSKAKFEEWWMKAHACMDCNPHHFAMKDADGDLVPNVKMRMYTILSRLCGQKGSYFAETELLKLEQGILVFAEDWDIFVNEVEGLFWPILQKDWAKQQIVAYKQGRTPIDDYLEKWRTLYFQSKIDNAFRVYLLEQNVSKQIIKEVFRQNKWSSTVDLMLMAIWAVGKQIEAFELLHEKTLERPKCSNQEVTIDTAQRRGKSRCFNCQEEEHLAKDCKKLKNQCPKCKFLGGRHSWNCGDNHTVHTAETTDGQKEKDLFVAVRGMSFDAMKVYFYDMKGTKSLKDKMNWMHRMFSLLPRIALMY